MFTQTKVKLKINNKKTKTTILKLIILLVIL